MAKSKVVSKKVAPSPPQPKPKATKKKGGAGYSHGDNTAGP